MDRERLLATLAQASLKACDVAMDTNVPGRVRTGLMLLLESMAYAHDVAEDPWEFSVEWAELRRLGLTSNDGRWLIRKGLVQQARETTSADDTRRNFVTCKPPILYASTCFILTEEGLRLAHHIAVSQPHSPPSPKESLSFLERPLTKSNGTVLYASNELPVWDRIRRELRVGKRIIKEFKVPAPNQEIVLDVFEEENWPPRIDDPLPPRPGITSQRRLHDTINSLNRNQRYRLVRFFADGLGKGVRWGRADDCVATA